MQVELSKRETEIICLALLAIFKAQYTDEVKKVAGDLFKKLSEHVNQEIAQ